MRTQIAAAVIAVLAATAALSACKKESSPATTEPAPAAPGPATEPGAPAAPAAPSGESVEITFAVPAVGAKWSEEQTQVMNLEITAEGQTVPFQRETVEKKQIEVLAVSAEAVTKAKIGYEVAEKQTVAGKTQALPAPHSGKTYVVEAAGGKVTVTADGGAAASPAEVEAVTKAEDRFGEPDRMSKLIAGRTFKKGEVVEMPADQIADAMGGDEGMKVTKMTLTYTGASGPDALFDMAMSAAQENPDMQLTFDVTGKVTVDTKTGELLAMTMEGPMKMTGKTSATGTMKMTGTRTRR